MLLLLLLVPGMPVTETLLGSVLNSLASESVGFLVQTSSVSLDGSVLDKFVKCLSSQLALVEGNCMVLLTLVNQVPYQHGETLSSDPLVTENLSMLQSSSL